MVLQGNNGWEVLFLYSSSTASLWISWDRYVLLRRGYFLVPAELLGPRHAFKPSGHISLHSKNAAGHAKLGPQPGCCGWGDSGGAQEDGCFPTAGCSFSSECVTGFGLYTYFTALSSFYRRLFFFCYVYLAFFLEIANFQHIFKRFVSWHFEEICLQCIL